MTLSSMSTQSIAERFTRTPRRPAHPVDVKAPPDAAVAMVVAGGLDLAVMWLAVELAEL